MKSITGNDNRRVKYTMLYFKRVAIFRDKHYPNRSAFMMLFAFVVLISQVLENDIFSIEMDLCMQFCSSKGLEKNIHFKYFTKNKFLHPLL